MSKGGRKQTNPVHNHFKFDDIISTSICIHCDKSIPEKHSTNLLAHMKIYHPEITIHYYLSAFLNLHIRNIAFTDICSKYFNQM